MWDALFIKFCFVAVIAAGIAIVYYAYDHTANFFVGDKVTMAFKGSPAVLAACAFGNEEHKPLITKLSDHDRIDVSPCGTVAMYSSNGGLDFQQVKQKCADIEAFISVKHNPCDTSDTPSNKGCANALAFHCSKNDTSDRHGNKQSSNCTPFLGHGFTGKCNVKKGVCEKGTPPGKSPPNKDPSIATCVPTNPGQSTKGKCYLFANSSGDTEDDRWKACLAQFGCCKQGNNECGAGQKCCKASSVCKDNNNQGSGVCCGGLKNFQVSSNGMVAEGVVKKVHDKDHVSVQWQAIRVMTGGNPEQDCRLLRSSDNKEIHPLVFGSPAEDPKGISWLVPTGSTQSKDAKTWQLKSHKINTKYVGHIEDFAITHKKYPQDKSKYKNTDKCPPQMPYLTPNKGKNAQCCARQPVKKKMKGQDGNVKHVYVCPDATQCQQGDPLKTSGIPLCCQLPIAQNPCPHKHGGPSFTCPSSDNDCK